MYFGKEYLQMGYKIHIK